jgi:hypothetical protein
MTASKSQAQQLEQAIRHLGSYGHVEVRAKRQALYIYAGDEDPIARLSPVTEGTYALHYRNHHGRWEPMHLHGQIPAMSAEIVDILRPFLDSHN